MKVRKLVTVFATLCVALTLTMSVSAQEPLPYMTGFDDFTAGNLDGQDNWSAVPVDGAVVQGTTVQDGTQAVMMNANSSIDKSFDSGSYSVVWVEGYFRGEGSDGTPSFPATPASAIVFFDKTNGVRCLDGKEADPGLQFKNTGDPISDSTWTKVTILLDFDGGAKDWDCYVNDALKLSDLGFRDVSVAKFNGFTNFSSKESYLDSFTAVPYVLGDGNLNAKVDVGDVVLLTNMVNSAVVVTDAIVLEQLDVEAPDGTQDQADLDRLIQMVIGN
jgi:hypothetical protein